ncbi:MAG: ABC transporter ATP-binding protein [Eubacterium sp.]|nr:ABC transporter ATP-binding protein [Eubacterium sp.]
MITGIDLCKSFDDLQALDHATFTVETGSVYGLVGPNGSGKSTLIRHIMGVFRQDSGDLYVDGDEVYDNVAVKQRMAYVPDDIYFTNGSTLGSMSKLYEGLYPRFDRERLNRLIAVFPELKENLNFRRMSKGMQKQASAILAIATRASILILDEPMDGLDPVARHNIWKVIMDSVAEERTTVLVSSHNLRELEDVCDHVGIMDHGRIVMERGLDELQDGFAKVTIAYQEEGDMPELGEGVEVLHHTASGRLHTLILSGERELMETRIRETAPVFTEFMPLSLEEIFINELGGENDALKNIIA